MRVQQQQLQLNAYFIVVNDGKPLHDHACSLSFQRL